MATLFDHLSHVALRYRGFERRWLHTEVGRVHALEREGQGKLPHVVLVAGFSSRATNFARMAPRLLPHVQRVTILDLPGHGDSDIPEDGLTGDSLQTGVLAALRELTAEPAAIFGNSVGAWMALHHTLAHPGSVQGLLLVSPLGASMTTEEVGELQRAYRIETLADAGRMVDRVFYQVPGWFRPVMAFFCRLQIARPELQNLLNSLSADLTLSQADLARIEVPTRILWGQADGILPREHLDFFRAAIPHASVDEPHDYGHSPFMERPRDLAERLVDFLRDL